MRCAGLFVVASIVSGCSLLTNLDNLTGGGGVDAGADAPVDAQSTDTGPSDVVQSPDVADAGKPMYFRTITIQNNASTPLPAAYTIGVPFPDTELQAAISAGKIQASLNDLRVAGPSGERDRLVDNPPLARVVWFSIVAPIAANATDTSYSITYGIPSAPPAPQNGAAVFNFFDDFGGSAPDPHWSTQGTVQVGSGLLTLPAGGLGALTTLSQLPQTTAEWRAQITDPTSNPDNNTGFYYWFGFQRTGDFVALDPWALWIARAKNTVGAEDKADGCLNTCMSTPIAQDTAFHVYGVERQPTASVFSIDGAQSYTATTAVNDQAMSLMIRNWLVSSALIVDWMRSRTRIYPEPTVTLGSEQLK